MITTLKKSLKLQSFLIAVAFTFIGIVSYNLGFNFLNMVELKTVDLRFKSRGSVPTSDNVVLAVIDEKSVAREGKWVWPRSKMAQLVNKLSEAGARVVAFDIGFLEPDDNRVVRAVETIENSVDGYGIENSSLNEFLMRMKSEVNEDLRLATAIQKSTARVVLGYFFQMDPKTLELMNEEEIQDQKMRAESSTYKTVRYASKAAQHVPLVLAHAPQANVSQIAEATPYSGYFNMYPDPDGVVRWMPAVVRFDEMLYAPLSLMAVGAFLDVQPSLSLEEFGVDHIRLGNIRIPTDEYGRIMINYRGEQKSFPHLSITDILHDAADKAQIKDKIVIVGATATGIYDLRVTPFGTVFPGLEIHANIADSILAQGFLYQPAWSAVFDVLAMLVAGLFLGYILPRTGVLVGSLIAAAMFISYIFSCQILFNANGWVLNMIYPLLVILMAYVSITAYQYLVEARQKKFVKDAFSTYLAPSVVKQLIDSPEKLTLGGERKIITAFFFGCTGVYQYFRKIES